MFFTKLVNRIESNRIQYTTVSTAYSAIGSHGFPNPLPYLYQIDPSPKWHKLPEDCCRHESILPPNFPVGPWRRLVLQKTPWCTCCIVRDCRPERIEYWIVLIISLFVNWNDCFQQTKETVHCESWHCKAKEERRVFFCHFKKYCLSTLRPNDIIKTNTHHIYIYIIYHIIPRTISKKGQFSHPSLMNWSKVFNKPHRLQARMPRKALGTLACANSATCCGISSSPSPPSSSRSS